MQALKEIAPALFLKFAKVGKAPEEKVASFKKGLYEF
jgi:hypothetical protein